MEFGYTVVIVLDDFSRVDHVVVFKDNDKARAYARAHQNAEWYDAFDAETVDGENI